MAKIENSNSNTIISGTSGNDSIYNGSGGEISGFRTGSNVTINGGEGNDYIFTNSGGTNILINGGDGNDTVYNFYCHEITINGGYDNDSIATFTEAEINGDAGNDTLVCEEFDCTAKGGADSDVFVYRNSNRVDESYANFFITDYAEEDIVLIETTNISDISTTRSGNVVFQLVGNGSIILENASDKVITYIDNSGSKKTFRQVSKLITLTEGNDTYSNTVEGATIQALGGKDSIYNDASNVSIDAGAGNDYIENNVDAEYVSINGGTGNDTIYGGNGNNVLTGGKGSDIFVHSSGNYVIKDYSSEDIIRFASGAFNFHTEGNDLIFDVDEGEILVKGGTSETITFINQFGYKFVNFVSHMLLTGTSGNDYIYNNSNSNDSSILGNAGDDKLKNRGSNVMISGGDGKDIIYNEGSNVTIIGGKGSDTIYNEYGSYGENVLFKYASGDGNDIIYGFMSDSTLSISGGSYSTTKSGSNIIVTVGDGKISLMGAASLSSVKIDGTEETVETNSWKLDGTTATYGTSSNTLIKLTNIKSLSGVSLSGNVVTIAKAAVNAKTIKLTGDGYTLALAGDVTKRTTKKAAWSYSNGTATYKSSYKTAEYKLASNSKSISYTAATAPTTLAQIKGAKAKPTISNDIIKLKTSTINSKVTLSGSYEFDFASGDYKKAKILGSSSADRITSRGKNISLNGGAGNDTIKVYGSATSIKGGNGADVFVFDGGSGIITDYAAEDKISIVSGTVSATTSGDNVILTAGSKKITVKGGKDTIITYFDANGEHIYPNADDEKIITLADDYDEEIYTMGSKLRTLDASAVALDLEIVGNKLMNSILGGDGNDTLIGGKSNDTLTGGNGADVFLWNKGDSNDLITDYKEEDTILITGDTVKTKKASGEDLILNLAGKNKITITGGAYKIIDYIDDSGENLYSHFVTYNDSGTSAKLKSGYSRKSFKSSDYEKYIDTLVTINASAVSHAMSIVGSDIGNSIMGTATEDYINGGGGKDTIRGGDGNDSLIGGGSNDYLYGGAGNDTLWGGAGNDYLYGGEGEDIFLYKPGESKDRIYDYNPAFDTIKLLSGTVDNVGASGTDIVFTIGKGKIVLDSAASNYAKIVDSNGNTLKEYFPSTRS